jgi:hypothetical protein
MWNGWVDELGRNIYLYTHRYASAQATEITGRRREFVATVQILQNVLAIVT